MANPEHVDRLLQGVEAWNQWRQENPDIKPDLSFADFSNANLSFANLRCTDLRSANLSNTNFSNADFSSVEVEGSDSRDDYYLHSIGSLLLHEVYAFKVSDDIHNDPFQSTNPRRFKLYRSNLSNANLSHADLSNANLNHANLNHAILHNANLGGANLEDASLFSTKLIKADLSGASLCGADLINADLSEVKLLGAYLIGAKLGEAILSNANFFSANLRDANLRKSMLNCADLRSAQALNANFQGATLTGAVIADWNINAQTKLEGVVCEHIFIGCGRENGEFIDRRPHDPNQIFAPGEFTKRYQIVLETVDLFFNDGIDWQAFLASLQDLKAKYGDDLNIQGIEKKAGGSFVVRLEVPSGADKGTIERTAKELYETKLEILEAKYHVELQAKDKEIESYRRESANMMEITKLLASKPITVEAKAVAENQSSSESYTNHFSHSTIGNFANKMQDQASQHTTQNIGANLNEITMLIQSLRSKTESFPEVQRTEAIDHLTDLETDLQQPPEKRKVSRMKAALLSLLGIATAVSGAVTNTNEFVGQVQELSEKLGIEMPIAQPQSQNAIDVQAIDSPQP